ncbi:MAG: aromatic amino acid transaminase [Caulobacteraceae bacterium]|nr:aromatic amino acid transaminase [Caulobacteraceae bacterium]
MLDSLDLQPPDPLLSLTGLFAADPREGKLDLGVGVYRDEHGRTPVMRAVKAAEARLLAGQDTKAYVGPSGDLQFIEALRDLVFGASASKARAFGLQTPGGTAALRAAADLLVRSGAGPVWVGRPTWANHDPIFAAAGLASRGYDYFAPATQSVDFERLMSAARTAARGDVMLLQAGCHNPTGADLSADQWRALAEVIGARGLIAFIDVAYQGLGAGLEEDIAGAMAVVEAADEALVAVSCSKSFGLYRERTGALFAVTKPAARSAVESNMLAIARANYSMPPDHGAAVVRTILSDPLLAADWRLELAQMQDRIRAIRLRLAEVGANAGLDLGALAGQQGMFSLLPLSGEEIRTLREDNAIYMTGAGRVNLAGLRIDEAEAVVSALAALAGR